MYNLLDSILSNVNQFSMFYSMFAVDITDTISWQFVLRFDDLVANLYKLDSQNAWIM